MSQILPNDQSVSSMILKQMGSVVVEGEMEVQGKEREKYPFHAARLGHREGHRWSAEELKRIGCEERGCRGKVSPGAPTGG